MAMTKISRTASSNRTAVATLGSTIAFRTVKGAMHLNVNAIKALRSPTHVTFHADTAAKEFEIRRSSVNDPDSFKVGERGSVCSLSFYNVVKNFLGYSPALHVIPYGTIARGDVIKFDLKHKPLKSKKYVFSKKTLAKIKPDTVKPEPKVNRYDVKFITEQSLDNKEDIIKRYTITAKNVNMARHRVYELFGNKSVILDCSKLA